MSKALGRLGPAAFVAACLLAMVLLPALVDLFTLLELTVYVVMAVLALSLGFIWGYGGILCFGQAAFFGLGAYTYAVAAINFGDSTGAVLLAMAIPSLFALALGYFMFYGRISDVYLGVITLTVSLILFSLFNSTSDASYRIGGAALGGFNGMPAVPTINVPGRPTELLFPEAVFRLCVAVLLIVYVGLKGLLASRFGRIVVAIRENEQRASLLGHDTRRYKLGTFMIGGAIAGLAGCLFVNWGAFVSPGVFGLAQSAQIIIWTIVGGLGTLLGPVVGAFLIQWLTSWLGSSELINTNLVLGVILIGFVLLVPQGLLPTLRSLGRRLRAERKGAVRHEAETFADADAGGGSGGALASSSATPLTRTRADVAPERVVERPPTLAEERPS